MKEAMSWRDMVLSRPYRIFSSVLGLITYPLVLIVGWPLLRRGDPIAAFLMGAWTIAVAGWGLAVVLPKLRARRSKRLGLPEPH
jgi:hypothetical protein